MAKHLVAGKLSASVEEIIGYLKGTSKDKLMQAYYDRYKALGQVNSADAEKAFLDEMSMLKHILDWPLVQVIAISRRRERQLKKEIVSVVRFLGADDKEHIRYSATYDCLDKDGTPTVDDTETRISGHCNGIGVWEEPVFGRRYDKNLEEYVPTLSIASTKPHYEYDWPDAIKQLSKEFTKKTRFYIQDNQRKYRIDRKDWETLPWDTLIKREKSKDSQDSGKMIGELVDQLQKNK